MKIRPLITRAIAAVALTASVVTIGQVPGSPVKIANASLSYDDVSQPRRVGGGEGFMCMEMNSAIGCSGSNASGQLGDGTNTSRNYLKRVSDNSNISNPQQLAVGKSHACAVAGSASTGGQGKLYCWGDNTYGQLGDGTTTNRNVPTLVVDNGSFTNASVLGVIAGDNHTCAIVAVSAVNRLFCWGYNNKGQLGDNSTTNRALPTAVQGTFATNAVWTTGQYYMPEAAAGAEHTCAAGAGPNYTIYCWGANSQGQLGDGTTTDRLVPTTTGLNGTSAGSAYAAFLTAGAEFTCATPTGSVKCWGDNAVSQLGNGLTADLLVPTTVPNSGSFTNNNLWGIAAGGQTACVTQSSGTDYKLWCWGANTAGQIGDGTTTPRSVPTLVSANSAQGFDNLTLGNYSSAPDGVGVARSVTNGFTCVTKWCWGKNSSGQLAQGTSLTDLLLPTKVKVGTVSADAVTGATVTAVLKSTGVVVTVNGVPATAPTYISITVAPASKTLLPNQAVVLGDKYYMSKTYQGASIPTVSNGSFSVTLANLIVNIPANPPSLTTTNESFNAATAYHVSYTIRGAATSGYADGWKIESTSQTVAVIVDSSLASSSSSSSSPAAATPAASPAASPAAAASYANAVPGVTVTDTKVYTTAAPAKVAGNSAISVITPADAKTSDVVSLTPSICLPNDEDLVFIDEGKCIAQVVNEKTRKVLRTLKTTVVADDIADLQVGNEVAVLSPLYFFSGTTTFKPSSLARLASLKAKIATAGSVLVAGHSGTLTGNTPENVALSKQRAQAAVRALKARGSKGPFAIAAVGALDPASTKTTQEAQDLNRRVVIVLIP